MADRRPQKVNDSYDTANSDYAKRQPAVAASKPKPPPGGTQKSHQFAPKGPTSRAVAMTPPAAYPQASGPPMQQQSFSSSPPRTIPGNVPPQTTQGGGSNSPYDYSSSTASTYGNPPRGVTGSIPTQTTRGGGSNPPYSPDPAPIRSSNPPSTQSNLPNYRPESNLSHNYAGQGESTQQSTRRPGSYDQSSARNIPTSQQHYGSPLTQSQSPPSSYQPGSGQNYDQGVYNTQNTTRQGSYAQGYDNRRSPQQLQHSPPMPPTAAPPRTEHTRYSRQMPHLPPSYPDPRSTTYGSQDLQQPAVYMPQPSSTYTPQAPQQSSTYRPQGSQMPYPHNSPPANKPGSNPSARR